MQSNAQAQFAPIKKVNLSQQLVEYFIHNIESGIFPVGERIPNEISLASQYNVSRNILRESMKILENYGILHTINGKGTIVSQSAIANIQSMRFFEKLRSDTTFLQFLEARLILEPQIAYYACQRCTGNDIAHLRNVISHHFDDVVTNSRPDDYDFHIALSRICGNDTLTDFLMTILCRFRESSYAGFNNHVEKLLMQKSFKEHDAILDACEKKDPDEARRLMTAHLQERIDIIRKFYNTECNLEELDAETVLGALDV